MTWRHWCALTAAVASAVVPVIVRARRLKREGTGIGNLGIGILGFTGRDPLTDVAVAVELGTKPVLVYLCARIAIAMTAYGVGCALAFASTGMLKMAGKHVSDSMLAGSVRATFASTAADIFEARVTSIDGLREMIAVAPLVAVVLIVVHVSNFRRRSRRPSGA